MFPGMGHLPSLGSLFQCFTTLIVKNVFLIYSLNLPSFSLKPLPLILSQQALLKSLSPSFLQAPFRYWQAAVRSPWSLCSPGWTAPPLSAFPHRRGVPSLWSFLWLSSGPTPTRSMSFPCWGLQSFHIIWVKFNHDSTAIRSTTSRYTSLPVKWDMQVRFMVYTESFLRKIVIWEYLN